MSYPYDLMISKKMSKKMSKKDLRNERLLHDSKKHPAEDSPVFSTRIQNAENLGRLAVYTPRRINEKSNTVFPMSIQRPKWSSLVGPIPNQKSICDKKRKKKAPPCIPEAKGENFHQVWKKTK